MCEFLVGGIWRATWKPEGIQGEIKLICRSHAVQGDALCTWSSLRFFFSLVARYVLRSVLHILPSNYDPAKSIPLCIYVQSPASPAMYVSGDSSQCHETYFQGLATLLEPLIPPQRSRHSKHTHPAWFLQPSRVYKAVWVKPSGLSPLELYRNDMGLTVSGPLRSQMKLYQGAAFVVTAHYIHTAVALYCSSSCAACWKDNNKDGVDIKFWCTKGECGTACPQGYSRMHCANKARCVYVDPSSLHMLFFIPDLPMISNQSACPLLFTKLL